MKRKIISLLLLFTLLLPASCGQDVLSERYEGSFLDLFDTVTYVIGYSESKEEFTDIVQGIYDELSVYHKLYDIYNTYDGINNIKTINDNAGLSPVAVDSRIIDMLEFCKEMYYATDGALNVAMGSVLRIWHNEREYGILNPDTAKIPSHDELSDAAKHTSIEDIIIDRENSTVYLADKHMSLDVGAVAKGYAVEKIAETLPEGYLLSVGGNVKSTGPKNDGGKWSVGVQDPENEEEYLHLLDIAYEAVVSGGTYQRNYVAEGKLYHHIIDPKTLMPGENYTAVTIICEDSAVADALSTALFLSDIEEGKALLEKFGSEAMWVYDDGREVFSEGFREYIK